MSELLNGIIATLPPEYAGLFKLARELEKVKEYLGIEGEYDNGRDDLLNAHDVLADRFAKLEQSVKVIHGALETTIERVRELADDKAATVKRAHTEAQRQSSAGRGLYCNLCGKRLEKEQRVFCSRKHAKRWQDAHPDERAAPLLTPLRNDMSGFSATVVAGEGVTKGSV